jgi:hypothetical protein
MKFVTLFQELAYLPKIVTSLVAGVSQSEARAKPDPEARSFVEVVCHLYDEEREDFRPRLELMLYQPKDAWPPIDPEGWVTARKYNEQDLETMLEKFIAERARSLDWLRRIEKPNWEAKCETPFGIFKTGDMLAAWAAHDNLHTRQLVELRRARILKITKPYRVEYAGDW